MRNLFGMRLMSPPSGHEALREVIRSVRNRWRVRIAIRGLAILLSTGVLVFLVSAYGMDQFRFTPTAIFVFRVVAYSSLIAVAIRFLVMPLWRQVSDERVALYLEEHEPSLQGQMLSAVEFGAASQRVDPSQVSPALIRRLVEGAVAKCGAIDNGRRVEQPRLTRSSSMLAGATLMSVALMLLSPGFIRNSAPFLLSPWNTRAIDNPYGIQVAPGDVSLARGADLKVTAELLNFDSELVEITLRRDEQGPWERWPMTVDEETGSYDFLVFKIDDGTEYFVEASGVRSSIFRIAVSDLPYVDRIDLEYRFPAYTGLSPQRYEDGGDIAALAGTRVYLTVIPTIAVTRGALVIDERDTIRLELADDGTLTGMLRVQREALYRVLLESLDGSEVVGSPDYYIDVLTDQPPAVWFTRPGRDVQVTSVDEVFAEVKAEDDYGVAQLQLVYSVNGSAADTLDLYTGGRAGKQFTAGHTFYLEELELEPGDFISYFARATDRKQVAGPQTTVTDIHFMEVRPFDRRYRQAESRGGGAGGGDVGELSSRQRQIVSATFNIVRDSARYSDKEMRENLATLALAQGRLREEVTTLVRRMETRRLALLDSTLQAIAEALPLAVQEMMAAEELLGKRQPQDALSPEQRALQHLQRAEAAYRDRVVSRGGGGGGGGRQEASAEELADLFDLELDRLRNQYESVDRGERRRATEQIDEVLEKLRELARRQQQENERMRAQAQNLNSEGGGGGGGGGSSRAQRRLAQGAEQVARQLERLARQQSQPELQETARRIREAAEAMRRAAANQRSDGTGQGNSALERLREARQLLETNRSAGLEREVRDALRRAERLVEQERDVIRDVEQLTLDPEQRLEHLRRLIERKNQMAGEVEELEAQLDRLGRDARRGQPDASRRLREAAKGMRDSRLADKILFSRGVVEGRSAEYARNFEEQIGSDLEDLERRIREALGAIGESREQRLTRSLDRARDLVNALESLDERMRARAEQQGRQGRQEQQGRQGQERRLQDRQFRRELAERRSELGELRQELRREGVDVRELGNILRRLGRLDNQGEIGTPRGLDQLKDAIIPGLKEFEYALRRQLEGPEQQLFLTGSDEVPAEYRKLVEQYYKALSVERR